MNDVKKGLERARVLISVAKEIIASATPAYDNENEPDENRLSIYMGAVSDDCDEALENIREAFAIAAL